MHQNKLRLEVVESKGKMIKMTDDKRRIVMRNNDIENVTVIDTLPWGFVVSNN